MGADESWVVGWHAVLSALKMPEPALREIWMRRGRQDQRSQELLQRAAALGVRVHQVDGHELDHKTPGINHQGVVAAATARRSLDEADLFCLLDGLNEPPFLLVLDGVQDPHNLGACLRTADAAGVHAVIAPRDRAVGLTPGARKAAAGAAESLPFIQVTNLARVLRQLQERGVWLVGTSGDAGQSLYSADLKGPLGLVLGAEEKGMRRLTREHCDLLVSVPMQGRVESLNVSVAAAICLYEALRQRH